uniref:Uncharacterized protein n=2 Tax=Plectus sambesii TaxID=2011161 RepID=A0A914XN37_9BILA
MFRVSTLGPTPHTANFDKLYKWTSWVYCVLHGPFVPLLLRINADCSCSPRIRLASTQLMTLRLHPIVRRLSLLHGSSTALPKRPAHACSAHRESVSSARPLVRRGRGFSPCPLAGVNNGHGTKLSRYVAITADATVVVDRARIDLARIAAARPTGLPAVRPATSHNSIRATRSFNDSLPPHVPASSPHDLSVDVDRLISGGGEALFCRSNGVSSSPLILAIDSAPVQRPIAVGHGPVH